MNNIKKYSLSSKQKPLFDDDLEDEEESKNEPTRTFSISVNPEKIFETCQFSVICDLSNPYISDLRYILSKITSNHLLVKAKDQDFLEKFISIFEEKPDLIKKSHLKNLCFDSIPEVCKRIRPLCWRILLNCLPEEKAKWSYIEENNKRQYEEYINLFLLGLGKNKTASNQKIADNNVQSLEFKKCNDHPLSKAKNSNWNIFFSDQSLWDEIAKDTNRTRKDISFFTCENSTNLKLKYPSLSKNKKENKSEYHYEALTRILFVFAKKYPKIGYAQGMNEILAPIYYCFINDDKNSIFSSNSEADSFICFSQLMQEIQENFLKIQDSEKIGLELQMKDFNELLKKIDSRVFEHMKKNNISVQLFGFQWLLLMLSQEFSIDDVLKLWDSLLSHDKKKEYLNYMCIAILYIMREEILKGEYSEIILALQNLRQMDVKLIQEKAKSLYNEYVIFNESYK